MRAWLTIRDQPHYRQAAFAAGLKAAGHEVRIGCPDRYGPDELLCCWNRYGQNEQVADKIEAAGGVVIVCENGYIGPGGISPHAMEPRTIYAIAIGGHNGSGTWHVGGPERFKALGVTLKPWKNDDGEFILIAPNREFGRRGFVQPPNWAENVAAQVRTVTDVQVRIRPHPGNDAPKVPLERDLEGCLAMIIWSSSAGVQALIEGIPVMAYCPAWVLKDAATSRDPYSLLWKKDTAARQKAFEDLAWQQFSVEEISSGMPFDLLLPNSKQAKSQAVV